jgi:hypothetical protein
MHVQASFSYNSQIIRFQKHLDMDTFLVLTRGSRTQNLSALFNYTLYKIKKKDTHYLLSTIQ